MILEELSFEIRENTFRYVFSFHVFSKNLIWIEVWRQNHLCYRKLQRIVDSNIDWSNDCFGDLAKHFPKHIQDKTSALIRWKVFL